MTRKILALFVLTMLLALVPVASQADDDTYFTDFSEYTRGVQPSDWTERWSPMMKSSTVIDTSLPPDATGGAVLRIADQGPFVYRYALSWDVLDGAENVDIAFRAYTTWPVYKFGQLGAVLNGDHVNPAAPYGTYVGYVLNQQSAYYATTDNSSFPPQYTGTSYWSLGRYGGTNPYNNVPLLGMAAHPEILNANTWNAYRFQFDDGTLRVKVWADGDTEPTGWMLTVTDVNPLDAGWNGLLVSIFKSTTYIDWFAAGIDGAAPPIPE